MDSKPDKEPYDHANVELEITDLDAEEPGEEGEHSTRSSKFEPLFSALMRHARLWFVLAIVVGCVVIALLIFPDAASLVTPASTSPTPTAPAVQLSYTAMTGTDNVTFVMAQPQTDTNGANFYGGKTNVTAYDTRTGALLWRTPQSLTSGISYGLTFNLSGQEPNIYALHADGQVSLLAPRTGKVLWSYKSSSPTVKSFAYEQDNVFFLSDSSQDMYAIKDGRMLWRSVTLGQILAIDDGVIYAYDAQQGHYDALDEASGARLWTYSVPSSTQSSAPTTPSFAVENKTFYVQASDHKVLALQAQGHVAWSHQFDDIVNLRADAHHLYAFTRGSDTLTVLNLQTGQQEYTNLPGTGIANVIDMQNNLLYIQTDGVELQSIDTDTGSVVWKRALATNQTAWTLQGGLYISSSTFSAIGEGPMQAINERDGTVLWSKVIKSHMTSFNDRVLDLMSDDNHTISILRLSDGKILWSKHIG